MKLAEALKLRSDLNDRLYQLQSRLTNNSKVQEGESPNEDPKALLAELDDLTSRLEELIWRINTTNCMTKAESGETLTQLIAKRDVLIKKSEMLRTFLDDASSVVSRQSASEIKIRSTVDVRALRKNADSISESVRVIDTKIQELNWTVELI